MKRRTFKRIRFFAVVILVLVVVSVSIYHNGSSAGIKKDTKEIIVMSGDSLWNLALKHLPDEDPRAVVEEIKKANGMSGVNICAGQTLLIPQK